MVYSHHLQCILKDIFCNKCKPCLVYLSHVPNYGRGHSWKVWENVWNHNRIHEKGQQVAFRLNAHFGVKTRVKCAMTLASEWVSKWAWAWRNLLKYSMPHHGIFPKKFPCGINIWWGKIFHTLPWNILPHHKHDLLGNQQLFIDFKHIIILGATNAPNI